MPAENYHEKQAEAKTTTLFYGLTVMKVQKLWELHYSRSLYCDTLYLCLAKVCKAGTWIRVVASSVQTWLETPCIKDIHAVVAANASIVVLPIISFAFKVVNNVERCIVVTGG